MRRQNSVSSHLATNTALQQRKFLYLVHAVDGFNFHINGSFRTYIVQLESFQGPALPSSRVRQIVRDSQSIEMLTEESKGK